MRPLDPPFAKLIIICTNCRDDGRECCAAGGSERVWSALKSRVKEAGLPIRVSRSGCLGMCATGPTVAIMPDGLWLGGVAERDVDAILEMLRSRI